MQTKLFVALSMSLLLVACGSATIDSSSDEAMKASVLEVREDLTEADRATFDQALQIVVMEAAAPGGNLFAAASKDPAVLQAQMRASLQGKTAADVTKMAADIRSARAAKEREQVLGEIKELEEKQANAASARAELAKFEVTRSRYFKQKRQYMGEQPVIELSVKNGTEKAVARAYFVGTIASPGRSVPWLKDSFNYPISGGLEPSEAADWSLAPNMFSKWGTLKAPDDAVLTVEVTRLDGADGEPLFDAGAFDDDDGKRLSVLRSQLTTLEKLSTLD